MKINKQTKKDTCKLEHPGVPGTQEIEVGRLFEPRSAGSTSENCFKQREREEKQLKITHWLAVRIQKNLSNWIKNKLIIKKWDLLGNLNDLKAPNSLSSITKQSTWIYPSSSVPNHFRSHSARRLTMASQLCHGAYTEHVQLHIVMRICENTTLFMAGKLTLHWDLSVHKDT